MNKIILGDGLLGSELVKQTDWDYISRKKDSIDFTDFSSYRNLIYNYDVVVNCIAYTNTYDTEREKHWETNYKGVAELVQICNILNKKLIHISTDYLYSNSESNASEEDVPVHCKNWYGYTKLLADGYVQLEANNYLVIRCTHKPYPFSYEEAFVNQIGNFDYVNNISQIIVKLIENDAQGVYNVGTEMKSMYNMAVKTKEDVRPVNRKIHDTMPSDVSMNIDKLNIFLKDKD